MEKADILASEIWDSVIKRGHKYGRPSLSIDELMQLPGFGVEIGRLAYLVENYPDEANEDVTGVKEEMSLYGIRDLSPASVAEYIMRQRAANSPLEIARLSYGIEVAQNMGSIVGNIRGIRVIGAESRLGARSKERGINDLDIEVDFSRTPNIEDLKDIIYCLAVAEDARQKTGILVDVLGYGFPVTETSIEHVAPRFDWEPCRGFPVFFRDKEYLEAAISAKKKNIDEYVLLKKKLMDNMNSGGLYAGTIG